jgi:hypothetical protein
MATLLMHEIMRDLGHVRMMIWMVFGWLFCRGRGRRGVVGRNGGGADAMAA